MSTGNILFQYIIFFFLPFISRKCDKDLISCTYKKHLSQNPIANLHLKHLNYFYFTVSLPLKFSTPSQKVSHGPCFCDCYFGVGKVRMHFLQYTRHFFNVTEGVWVGISFHFCILFYKCKVLSISKYLKSGEKNSCLPAIIGKRNSVFSSCLHDTHYFCLDKKLLNS